MAADVHCNRFVRPNYYNKMNNEQNLSEPQNQKLNIADVSGSTLPDCLMDWNTLSLDQMVECLRKKYMFSSSGDAKCIYHLIEFYDKHK